LASQELSSAQNAFAQLPSLLSELCITRHCERSEAIQKTSGSPRRFAARDDDPLGFSSHQNNKTL